MGSWEFLDHTADVRLFVRGGDIHDLFITAARALMEVLVGVVPTGDLEYRTVRAEGEGFEELLVDWLRELLFLFQGEGVIAVKHDIIEIDRMHLIARCGCAAFDPMKMSMATDVKAITYHDLVVTEDDRGVSARIVCDV
ncbi:MAG: archease [Deltaproteobacteria bacterium]|nr:archease [Candidatus Zymogenaceae bacterium]